MKKKDLTRSLFQIVQKLKFAQFLDAKFDTS